jgi:hypothetical protein
MLIRREDFGDVELYSPLVDSLFELDAEEDAEEYSVLEVDTKSLLLGNFDYICVLAELLSRLNEGLLTNLISRITLDIENIVCELKRMRISSDIWTYAAIDDLYKSIVFVAKEAARCASMHAALSAHNSDDRNKLLVEVNEQKLDTYLSWMHSIIEDNHEMLEVVRDKLREAE